MPGKEEKLAEGKKAHEEFIREYGMTGLLSEYVTSVALTHRFVLELMRRDPGVSVGEREKIIWVGIVG